MQPTVVFKTGLSQLLQSIGALCFILSFSTVLHADDAKGKIAVLDIERAVLTTDMARERIKALESQKDYVDLRKKIEAAQQDREKKIATAKKEGPTWTSEQQASYQSDMEFIQKNLQLSVQKIQSQSEDLARTIMKEMEPKLKTVVNETIAEDKISVLVRREAVLMAIPDADITAKVTEKLNKLK